LLKKQLYILLLLLIVVLPGCSLFKNAADRKTGFSKELTCLEEYIAAEQWDSAAGAVDRCMEKWDKIRPWMQIEIDHDVIDEIDMKFTELTAYLETREKSMSLAATRVIVNIWADIGSK